MKVAGGALIVPRPVYVALAGREYRIPPLPAARWMLVLLEQGWADIVPGLCEGDLDELYEDLDYERVSALECERAAQDAVTATAGVEWWTATKLLHSAASDPAAFGELRSSGLDVETAPLGAVLVALYRIYTRDKERGDVAKVDMELAKPPPTVTARSRYNPDAAAAAFESAFASRGGR